MRDVRWLRRVPSRACGLIHIKVKGTVEAPPSYLPDIEPVGATTITMFLSSRPTFTDAQLTTYLAHVIPPTSPYHLTHGNLALLRSAVKYSPISTISVLQHPHLSTIPWAISRYTIRPPAQFPSSPVIFCKSYVFSTEGDTVWKRTFYFPLCSGH